MALLGSIRGKLLALVLSAVVPFLALMPIFYSLSRLTCGKPLILLVRG